MGIKLLSANAREAWFLACDYCGRILDGFVTLQYKKTYVSMLHNSVELLLKQRMLDLNDHRVVKLRNIDASGGTAKDYYNATDLNQFFLDNGTKDANGKSIYCSIEFHEFRDLHKSIFSGYYIINPNSIQIICSGLKLLEDLRNDETHFYVKEIDFLNGTNFKNLHTFMLEFTEVLDYYGLLPTISNSISNTIKPSAIVPSRYDYKTFLKNNADAKTICNYLDGKTSINDDDPFEITDFLFFRTGFNQKSIQSNYAEVISLITGLVQYKVLKIKEESGHSVFSCKI